MRITFAFSFLLLTFLGISQMKPISTARIKSLEEKALICIDSNGKKTSSCSIDLDGFHVEFYKAFFDDQKSELRIIGRIPYHGYIGIYLGYYDSIPVKTPISRTSYDKEYINNDGFFDVTFNIKTGSVLYFYDLPYFARQFNISNLLLHKKIR